MSQHIVSWRVYVLIFAVLCVLTVVTVQVAGHDFGAFNTLIAISIAVTKATLVVLYFMHVRYSGRLTTLVLCTGVVWLLLLILFMMGDYISRPWPIDPNAPVPPEG